MYKAVCLHLHTYPSDYTGTLEAFEPFICMDSEKILKTMHISHFTGVFVCVWMYVIGTLCVLVYTL